MKSGHLASSYHAFPLIVFGILARIHLVETKSIHQDVSLRRDNVSSSYQFTASHIGYIFSITAPYLPLCLVAFSWLLQGGFSVAIGDIASLPRCISSKLIWLCVGWYTSGTYIRLPAGLLASRVVESDGNRGGANACFCVSGCPYFPSTELIYSACAGSGCSASL